MIYIGSDHGGFALKEHVKSFLSGQGAKFKDLGNLKLDDEDDYPDYAFAVAEAVGRSDDPSMKWASRPKGILLCRSAAGVVVAANKVRNVRAAAAFDELSARKSREHNDANVIALSGDWTDEAKAENILDVWLRTEFSGEERHARRLKKISDYECRR